MSNFVVSARKYRPIRFDSVVGQAHVTNTLKNAIRNNHLAHAFLFCGPRGVGKTTCARILAKVLNCESPTSETEPCDECPSCKAFNENASLNIHELDAASNNSVEHIRALIEQVRFAPQRGRYKIYIIDEVHMLSQAAFNAFLKTLEEPPSYAIFILATTEKHKIIPTILSRCQIFDFNRIQISDMADHLRSICSQEGIIAEEDALNIIAQKADGALRDALSIYDRIVSFSGNQIKYQDVIENLNILDYDYYFRVVDAIVSEDVSELMLIFDSIQRKGFDGEIFINGLAEHLRNLLVCQRPETAALLEVSGNIKERYLQQASLVTTSIIVSALSLASDCDINYKMSRNKRLHVEMCLIKMAFIRQALQQIAFPSSGDGNEKKNSYKLSESNNREQHNSAAEHAYSYTLEKDAEKAAKKDLTVQANISDEDAEVVGEAAEDSIPPFVEKESMLKLKMKKGGLLSSLMSQLEDDEVNYINAKDALPWTIDNVQKFWEDYINEIESPSSQVLYRSALLDIIPDKDQVFITVKGSRAKDAIIRDNILLEKMRTVFIKNTIQFFVEVEEGPVEEIVKPKAKPQSDRDKYSYFVQINPLLADFQKRFGLYPADYNPKKK